MYKKHKWLAAPIGVGAGGGGGTKGIEKSISWANFQRTGGCQKKGAPHQKRFTWIIVAMNKENVDKSYVFVLS